MNTPPTFWRSPRSKPALPADEIEIPTPGPDPRNSSGYMSLLTTLLPMVLMVAVMILIGRAMGTSNWLLFSVPMMLVSGLAGVITFFLQKRKTTKDTESRKQEYRKKLTELQRRLNDLQNILYKRLAENDPEPEVCLERVANQERSLWSRSPDDEDFLVLRVGSGRLPSTITVKAPHDSSAGKADPLVEEAQKLAARYRDVVSVPITLSLRRYGIAGIAGPQEMVLDAIRALVIQLATHHSPDEVKIVALYPAEEDQEWNWLRWLPHTWSDDRKQRFLANERDAAGDLLASLEEYLDQRINLLRDRSASPPPTFSPQFVFLLADEDLTANELLIQKLQTEGPKVGAFPIFVRDWTKLLPKSCEVAIRLRRDQSFVRSFSPSTQDVLIAPDLVNRHQAEQFAKAMAPIRLQRPAAKEIPGTVSLLELFSVAGAKEQKVTTVDELAVVRRWQASQKVKRSLEAVIGLKAGAKPLVLDLHERKHGPNGLVAGMVGAGKSELLQTLVASMAINYHPHKVGFVLVDYKGGGMADPFETLPHTLGVITNLQKGNLATRALTSFKVELDRRLQLFKEATVKTGIDVNHIDTYQSLYNEGKVEQPLPHLVVIVDEFAEMKTEQPEVAKEFVKIARLGRAPGLCLILAMQKPSGIVDGQIEGNTRFRLCLRVASTEDSQAMLKRPDAAYLVGTGRAYLQVGANEIFDVFQVAWSGAPYDPLGLLASDPLEIKYVALNGQRQPARKTDKPKSDSVTQLKAVVNHLREVADSEGIERLQGLWLPPLPEQLDLEDVRPAEGWDGKIWQPVEEWLAPVVGLVDDPQHQRQEPLRIPFGREGHLIVYSAPGYGKTTLVQTLITSLALTYSPDDVNIYALDFGGRLLKQFELLPHVGGVVSADEPERLQRLLGFLLKAMDERRERFGVAGVGTLAAYRSSTGESLPAIVVFLDNYANFRDSYEENEDTIMQLVRDGATLGIHVVLTVNDTSTIRFRITSSINMAVALQMVEAGDYAAIVGRTEGLVPTATPGRGLIRAQQPLEFQTALPIRGVHDAERAKNLRALLADIAASWTGPHAPPVRVMPSEVALSDILPPGQSWLPFEGSSQDALSAPLGLQSADLDLFSLNLDVGPNFLIAGPARSGKTSLLQTWMLALAERFAPCDLQFFILDSRRAGLAALKMLPHVKGYSEDSQQSDACMKQISNLLASRQQQADVWRRSQNHDADGLTASHRHPAIVIVADDMFDPYNDGTSEETKTGLTAVLRQGRSLGFYALIAGPSEELANKGWNEPIKTLKSAQLGFMLGRSEDTVLNLRLPYPERDKILPTGEAYWVCQGQSIKVKLASAQIGDPKLSMWAEMLRNRFTVSQVSNDETRQTP